MEEEEELTSELLGQMPLSLAHREQTMTCLYVSQSLNKTEKQREGGGEGEGLG